MESFTFGIPLVSRRAARDWERIERLLAMTLRSLLAQSDPRFEIVVAGHDRPACLPSDERTVFVRADWPPAGAEPRNVDGGRKKFLLKERVLARGGGLLMFVDADDWLDVHLVENVRARMRPHHAAAALVSGWALDVQSLRIAALPDPAVFAGGFDLVCGSSTLLRLDPAAPERLRRDPYEVLHEHHRLRDVAAHHGLATLRLGVRGCYLVNTAENHSELHGPVARWRRQFTGSVNARGRPLDRALAASFGLRLDEIRRASRRLRSPRSHPAGRKRS